MVEWPSTTFRLRWRGLLQGAFLRQFSALFCAQRTGTLTAFLAPMQALPERSLDEIRLIGPRLMLNATATLGGVFRRCNALLSGGLEGVDALGEKVIHI